MNKRQMVLIQIAASILVIGAAVVYLMGETSQGSITYFYNADKLLAKQAEVTGKTVRLGGHVVEGSILQKKGTLDYMFKVKPAAPMVEHPEYAQAEITVKYHGVVPDTFKDDANVIVTGKLGADGVFHGDDLLAKCPSKYEAQEKSAGEYGRSTN